MRTLRLNILICCYADSVGDVPTVLLPERSDVRYYVSHQHPELWNGEMPSELTDRRDVVLSSFVGRGISQNRNHCLDMLISGIGGTGGDAYMSTSLRREAIASRISPDSVGIEEICLIADDDVRYDSNGIDTILSSFRNHPEAGLVFFRIATPQGSPEFKRYSDSPCYVTRPVLSGDGYLSSIETAFRLEPVAAAGVRFDEDFGIGSSEHPEGGEETVFLSDCLKSGIRALYLPEYVVQHPYESSGKSAKTVAKADMMLAVCLRTTGTFSFETLKAAARCLYRRILRIFGATI